jgi:hypothetical protein
MLISLTWVVRYTCAWEKYAEVDIPVAEFFHGIRTRCLGLADVQSNIVAYPGAIMLLIATIWQLRRPCFVAAKLLECFGDQSICFNSDPISFELGIQPRDLLLIQYWARER